MTDIERENLSAHVSLCELRYQALGDRLTRVETQLEELQTLVLEIRDRLAQQPQQNQAQWDRLQWGLIAALGGLVAFLLQHLFF